MKWCKRVVGFLVGAFFLTAVTAARADASLLNVSCDPTRPITVSTQGTTLHSA